MKTRCVCITWLGSLDDDVDHILWKLFGKHLRKACCWAEFLLVHVSDLVVQDENFVVVAVDRDRNVSEGDVVVCTDIAEVVGLFGLDSLRVVTHRHCLVDFHREVPGCCLSINKMNRVRRVLAMVLHLKEGGGM